MKGRIEGVGGKGKGDKKKGEEKGKANREWGEGKERKRGKGLLMGLFLGNEPGRRILEECTWGKIHQGEGDGEKRERGR